MGGDLNIVIWGVAAIATATDLLWGKIYNVLTLPIFFSGILFRFYFLGMSDGQSALATAVVAFAIFFPLFLLGVMAGGDVKLLVALSVWMPMREMGHLAFAAIVIGAAVGLVVLLMEQGVLGTVKGVTDHLVQGAEKKSHRMCFAPAVLCGLMILEIAKVYGWNWL